MSSTDLVVLAGSATDAPRPQSTGLRLVENFLQRWFLVLLPLVVLTGIGVMLAQRVPDEYLGSATLSASANPLVGEQVVRGLTGNAQESNAAGTARVINERLGTERFMSSVADRAGLADAVDSGAVTYAELQSKVKLIPIGNSLVDIEARWSDPETAVRLIEATLAEYSSVLQATVSGDAQLAVQFYEARRAEAVENAEIANQAVSDFVAELGAQLFGDSLPVNELELQRLNDRVVAAQAAIDAADAAIEGARLSVLRAESQAGGSLEVIDPPQAPFAPESNLVAKAGIVGGFILLGLLAAGAVLSLSTFTDRSVRSAADIEVAGGGITVAAVPVIKSLKPSRGLRGRKSADNTGGLLHRNQPAV